MNEEFKPGDKLPELEEDGYAKWLRDQEETHNTHRDMASPQINKSSQPQPFHNEEDKPKPKFSLSPLLSHPRIPKKSTIMLLILLVFFVFTTLFLLAAVSSVASSDLNTTSTLTKLEQDKKVLEQDKTNIQTQLTDCLNKPEKFCPECKEKVCPVINETKCEPQNIIFAALKRENKRLENLTANCLVMNESKRNKEAKEELKDCEDDLRKIRDLID